MTKTISVPVQFLNLVVAMREAQRNFFSKKEAYRKESHLKTAKELERQVDAYLTDLGIAIHRLDQFGQALETEDQRIERQG